MEKLLNSLMTLPLFVNLVLLKVFIVSLSFCTNKSVTIIPTVPFRNSVTLERLFLSFAPAQAQFDMILKALNVRIRFNTQTLLFFSLTFFFYSMFAWPRGYKISWFMICHLGYITFFFVWVLSVTKALAKYIKGVFFVIKMCM